MSLRVNFDVALYRVEGGPVTNKLDYSLKLFRLEFRV